MSTLLLAFALSSLTTSITTGPIADRLPYSALTVDQLAPEGLRHHEALRIDRDFGESDWDLVIDAWSDAKAPTIVDIRLWWLTTSMNDRRSPLSNRSKKYVDIELEPNTDTDWTVRLRGAGKEFAFDVELDGRGRARVYADVIAEDGSIDHCQVDDATLIARRLVGIPIGIAKLAVECTDRRGRHHSGEAEFRKVRR